MQLEVIGIGGAGCRIADAIRAAEPADHSFLTDVFVFDTDAATLQRTVVPESHRHQYGQGTGIDADDDLERRFEMGETHAEELLEALEQGTPGESDAFLVAVGLGGATGGGTAPALVAALQRRYDASVYVLATLPADREFDPDADAGDTGPHSRTTAAAGSDEPPRPTAASNAVATLERLEGLASAVVCFDNEAWLRPGETVSDARDRSNRELAGRVAAVFAGGGGESDGPVAQNVIDASDVERILGNESAIVALGYGDQDVETKRSRFGLGLLPTERDVETSEAVSAVETVVRKGVHGKLTLECDPETAARGLLVVGGPPTWLNRQAVAEGRRALQSTVGENGVLGGDAPRPDGETVFAAVVLAGVESDRLEELRAADRAA
ncbi:Tubulin/FtsZ GTPase [Haloterrigena turkmenica DSM 5511]|uniref:Tubulin-like protein CetZ n=1 Tax=Haloterrigena turkmenica (strain ATCC 51198 / DSM 5511 / JCM 9101 / NCIMB 13204 / VKM B-1734 / 4k) TaxID=543526 RepID=D2RR82_HALTV|nr:tubulin/FtsZ family protein [Haloterrigena turkmenica]ADB62478.1 Tubulin/FtsZ GTPase [Haloterrigena turkmenica DSM 5511]